MYLHVSIKDGSTVAATFDDEFEASKLSDDMLKNFIHIHVDDDEDATREEKMNAILPLIQPVMDGDKLAHKFRGKINLADTSIIPAKDQSAVIDKEQIVQPIQKTVPIGKITLRKAKAVIDIDKEVRV